jgi:type II secretory pathway pseudopilin PulG
MMGIKKKYKAFSLAELILAIALFGLVSSFLVLIVVDSTRTYENTYTKSKATNLVKEIYSALKILKTDNWFEVTQHTGLGEKHIEFVDGQYKIQEGEKNDGSLTYSFTVNFAQRDDDGNIVETEWKTDPHTRVININIKWKDRIGKEHTMNPKLYLNDWHINTFTFTTLMDFKPGNHKDTDATEGMTGGELRLQSVFYPDWCRPERSMTDYDIPGTAWAKSVFSIPKATIPGAKSYLGTRGEANGEPFTKLDILGVDPPQLTVEGTFAGYSINDIYVDGDYAYLATTDENKEIVILDVSSKPYTEVGYVNSPKSGRANSVFVLDNIGYMAHGIHISTFDLSSKEGSRPILGSRQATMVSLIGEVSHVIARKSGSKTYLFISLNWDWYEFAIYDVSNPSSLNRTARGSVNNQQVLDMYVSEDGSTLFFGTTALISEPAFYIIDSTNKSSPRTLATLNTGGTNVRGITVVEEGNVVIVVGTGGEEYQVYNIREGTNASGQRTVTTERCGGMDVNNGIYDVSSMIDSQGNTFSHIVTGDNNKEFKIVRGGPGGGNEETGNGFVPRGNYLSLIQDSKSTNSTYYTLNIKTQIPQNTSMGIQIRISDNPSMAGVGWFGPDGTSSTTYSTTGTYALPTGTKGRYFQYKVDFQGDTINTPLLEELIVSYEK